MTAPSTIGHLTVEALEKVLVRQLQRVTMFLQEAGSQVVYKNVLLLLAMYRELTMASVSPGQTQNLSQEVSTRHA